MFEKVNLYHSGKITDRISSEEELHEYYIDDSGEKCFYFSDIHDLFKLIFKDDKENRDRWNRYVD